MAFIKSRENYSNSTNYYYKVSDVTDDESAARWINNARHLPGIVVSYISLTDLMNRSDEGSESTDFLNDVSFEELKNNICERNIDDVSIVGTYFDKPIVVGVDLRKYYVIIWTGNENAADVHALEAALKLTD